jgi:uncharacterized protein (DUF427 family)
MSLTAASGPLSRKPSGELNVELGRETPIFYLQPLEYRLRAIFEQETVVDTLRPFLLHESDRLPVYHFAPADVRRDLLAPSGSPSEDAHRGVMQWWDLRVGERVAPRAAWSYVEPPESAPFLHDLLSLKWEAVDEWFCEDEQLFGHPRDPFSRIDVYRTTRHVRVSLDGVVLADTRRALVLHETGLPPRWYIPPEDVRTDLLEPSSLRTRCAYKGSAGYWSARVGDRVVDDLVWSYPEPQHDAERVRDLLCFFNERVDLDVEGERVQRPRTQWSRDD